MKKARLLTFSIFIALHCIAQKSIVFTPEQLKDKIKGGWAGQTIAVTFGGPYEFQYKGSFIQDGQPLTWYNGYLKKEMLENPGLYDDLYMDLTFVDVFERLGLQAPVDSFAYAFAHADYMLWHANQSARYNILNGIKAPLSGYWKNNPHADDIDYQIESDFAGLMSPGMPNTASAISNKIGHIMNYGDGWYGGVYVGAMYTLAFTSSDIHFIVTEALKTIPSQSTFYKCMSDVIKWHDQYPSDWHQTWFEIQKKWSSEIGCPEGVFDAFNIDAKINAAYVIMGLLYGNGDYTKTLDVATRAGQDADCNPSTAGGILGTVLGYSHIPAYWKQGLTEAEDINFKYTNMSLNKVYTIGYKHALAVIQQNGGKVSDKNIIIQVQQPAAVAFEQSFKGIYPVLKENFYTANAKDISFSFTGVGFALNGAAKKINATAKDTSLYVAIYIDDKLFETAKLPTDFTTRRNEITWSYDLTNSKHTIRIKSLNNNSDYALSLYNFIAYNKQD